MKAAEIISEIKGLTPEGYAEVSTFILQTERADPALQTALARKRASAVAETPVWGHVSTVDKLSGRECLLRRVEYVVVCCLTPALHEPTP